MVRICMFHIVLSQELVMSRVVRLLTEQYWTHDSTDDNEKTAGLRRGKIT